MWQKIKPVLISLMLYGFLLGGILLLPLLVLGLIFSHQSADVWIGAVGSYLGSMVAVIGTVIITRVQIKTERLDSLNNSIFWERYQMLNSLLSSLYHVKSATMEAAQHVRVIRRYLNNNGKLKSIQKYTQKFIDDFDANQFASFYSYTQNRLMSMGLLDADQNTVLNLVQKMFDNHHKLVKAHLALTRTLNQTQVDAKLGAADEKKLVDKLNNNAEIEGETLGIAIQLLDQLDGEIQRVIQLSHAEIVNR